MPVRSPFPDVSVPPVDVATYFFSRAQKKRDHRAASGLADEPPLLVDGETGESLTFSELKRVSESVAAALVSRGFSLDTKVPGGGLGHVAAVYSPPTIRMCAVNYGALIAGGAYVPIAPDMTGLALAQRLEEVRASVVFVAPQLLAQLLEAVRQLPFDIPDSHIILTRGNQASFDSVDSLAGVPDGTMLERLACADVDVTENAALVVYTSGSTGQPKGVVYTHRNIVAMFTAFTAFAGGASMFDTDVYLPSSSGQIRMLSDREPWHIYGHAALCYQALLSDGLLVQLPPVALEQYLGAIESYCINTLYATPGILYRIFTGTTRAGPRALAVKATPGRAFDISSVKAANSGTSTLLPHRLRQYSDHLGQVPILVGYGQSEAGFIGGSGSRVKPAQGYLGMSPGFVAKVIDTEGNETDGYGELCLSSPQIATHYANGNPIPLTDDGYLRTGDYVHLTADGQLRVIGRLCELCHTPEGLVFPADIDNELAQHPAVSDSIVVARNEGGNVRPVALVVPTTLPDTPAQLRDIEQSIRERMGIAIECREVPQIPRSSAGKPIWPLVNAMVS